MNRFVILIPTEVQCGSTPWWARPVVPAAVETALTRGGVEAAMRACYDAADLVTFEGHEGYAGGGECLRFPGSATTVSACQMQSRRKGDDGVTRYAYDPPAVQTVGEFFAHARTRRPRKSPPSKA